MRMLRFVFNVLVMMFGYVILTGAKLTPQEYAAKQASRLKAATQDIARGVDRVTEAPGVRAARKQDKMRQNIMQSIDDGTWARNTAAVPLQDWATKMKNKGIPRISTGIDEAKSKVEAFAADLLPFQDSLKAQVDAMPDLSETDREQRALTWMRGMRQFKRRGR